jgi:hypothetical protein
MPPPSVNEDGGFALNNNFDQRLRRHTITPPIMIVAVASNTIANEMPPQPSVGRAINTDSIQRNQLPGAYS